MPTAYMSVASREQELVEGSSKGKRRPKSNWREISLVQQYTLVKQIGKGGFSEIWLGEHKESGQQVAVKVVDLGMEDLEESEIANLIAEAKFLRTMDCPFLVKCLDMTHDEQWLVLVLEYLAGGEMLAHLHKVKKYTEVDAAKLFAQVVSAISYLHNLNLMHRDIKPENVMFTHPVEAFEAEGKPLRVKVIDMGMSALYSPSKEVRGCIGTCGFVAPEIWNDAPHMPSGDVYALGVMLFIMLTGRTPHSGLDIRTMAYCSKRIDEAAGLRDERYLNLSAEAKDLLLKMLADDPKARPTCLEVLKHPFMTADESNAAAHREMGDLVRNRMRDLARIRRMHGLQFALRMAKKQGADKQALLNALEQRRLKLAANGAGFFGRASQQSLSGATGSPPFARTSAGPQVPAFGRASAGPAGPPHPGGGVPSFARASAGPGVPSYTRGSGGSPVPPSYGRASVGPGAPPPPYPLVLGAGGSPFRTEPGGVGPPPARTSATGASPFARSSLAQSFAIELPQALAMQGVGWRPNGHASGGGALTDGSRSGGGASGSSPSWGGANGSSPSGGGANGSSPTGGSPSGGGANDFDIRFTDSPWPTAQQGTVLVLPMSSRPPPPPAASSLGQRPGLPHAVRSAGHLSLSYSQLAQAAQGAVGPAAVLGPFDSAFERGFGRPSMPPIPEPDLPGVMVMSRSPSGTAGAFSKGSERAVAGGGLGMHGRNVVSAAQPSDRLGEARPALPPWPPTSPPPCFAAAEPDASVQVVASVAVSAACGLPQQGNSRIVEAGLPSLREHDDSPREADCHLNHHHHHRHHMSVDPLALMNALPSALQRSTTMPAADDSWVPAMPSVELEPAALRRCMSVNGLMMDMMQHADAMEQVLADSLAPYGAFDVVPPYVAEACEG